MISAVLSNLIGSSPWQPVADRRPVWEDVTRSVLQTWQTASRDALNRGSAAELHAAREEYHNVLLGCLKILDGYASVSDCLKNGTATPTAFAARDQLQSHYGTLFPRWQTLEDLEAILLESITPSNDRLKELARRHRPPASWYDEPEFQPAEGESS